MGCIYLEIGSSLYHCLHCIVHICIQGSAVAKRFAEIGAYCEEMAYNCPEQGCKALSLVKHRCTPRMGCVSPEIGNGSAEIGYKCTEISIASTTENLPLL